MISPRTGWRWRSLTSTGDGLAAVDADVEDRARVGERVAQDARVDGEVRRLAVAAVDDAGHLARAAQAAGGARALGRAGGQRELRGVGHDLEGRRGQGDSTRRAAEDGSEMRSGDRACGGYSLSNVLRRGAACDLRSSPSRGPGSWRRAVPDVPAFRRRVHMVPRRRGRLRRRRQRPRSRTSPRRRPSGGIPLPFAVQSDKRLRSGHDKLADPGRRRVRTRKPIEPARPARRRVTSLA